jgi:hypothetical protein
MELVRSFKDFSSLVFYSLVLWRMKNCNREGWRSGGASDFYSGRVLFEFLAGT